MEPSMYEPSQSHLMEAAMCLWEEVVQNRSEEPYNSVLENVGAVELRHAVMALADPCCREWNDLSEEEQMKRVPYDWGWCPYFLVARCVWTPAGPVYRGAGQ